MALKTVLLHDGVHQVIRHFNCKGGMYRGRREGGGSQIRHSVNYQVKTQALAINAMSATQTSSTTWDSN